MLELKVSLDFACCHCQGNVWVTVKCEGKGLSVGGGAVAVVSVPCPHCHAVNQICFEPSGTVHAVAPASGPRLVPEPSLN